jgi:hypothetical protein
MLIAFIKVDCVIVKLVFLWFGWARIRNADYDVKRRLTDVCVSSKLRFARMSSCNFFLKLNWAQNLVKRRLTDVCVSSKLCFARVSSCNFFLKLCRAQNVEPLPNFKKRYSSYALTCLLSYCIHSMGVSM